MTQLSPHFSREELACRHCGQMHLPADFIDRLERVRVKVGFPLVVSSGYRCPAYNAEVSTTGVDGPHTKGAVDLAVTGKQALNVVAAALREGFTGIGVQQKGPHEKRFIHIDSLVDSAENPRPRIWSY